MRDQAARPIRFGLLVEFLAEEFAADPRVVSTMLGELVRHGVLITDLRAPFTRTDPLGHLLDRLRAHRAAELPAAVPLVGQLDAVGEEIGRYNRGPATDKTGSRDALIGQMMTMSSAARTPLVVDLRLDCEVRVPGPVVAEVERAATALLRLTRRPGGSPAWRDYHARFVDRYGTEALVSLTDVVDPGCGLGLPAGYPGSVLPAPVEPANGRDERFLALAWRAITDRSREIVLTDDLIRALADGDRVDRWPVPPHVEVAVRIQAASQQELNAGDYLVRIQPARAGGALTSRFTPTVTGSELGEVYRDLPTAIEGAVPVQMSFPPAHPHADNICRVPAYLPDLLPLGEHRGPDEPGLLPLDDLALLATPEALYLVSVSRDRVIEPQVLHGLDLVKQPPPLARFLAHLPRAFCADWAAFDWGPIVAEMPYLPRVRYGRAVLAPEHWALAAADLPGADGPAWRDALRGWRSRWGCPPEVDLRDDDRTLRLNLDEPLHATILREHLARHGRAMLSETFGADGDGWIGGHAHQVVLPLATTRPAAPSPLTDRSPAARPVLAVAGHGDLPGSLTASWLYARLHVHPEQMNELIAEHLPVLLAELGADPDCWFVRYRDAHHTDHLRLRLRLPGPEWFATYAATVGAWAQHLRGAGLSARLVLDTYFPEVGRYGAGPALAAAEAVFVADSKAVAAALRHLPPAVIDPTALAAVSMVDIAAGLLGLDTAVTWLVERPVPGAAADRSVADQVIRLTGPDPVPEVLTWPEPVVDAWHLRGTELANYRKLLPDEARAGTVAESLLHMHFNRALGIDPEHERTCRRLARQAALARQARR